MYELKIRDCELKLYQQYGPGQPNALTPPQYLAAKSLVRDYMMANGQEPNLDDIANHVRKEFESSTNQTGEAQ